ncbi:PREDICTED: uncharacterized protein LOC107066279, partial [Polistes dominula]|uniref:Uncharacterized protein LOC107066279 n=1 Tax=Polistes dominula TaxID=743375 RepID=A0ABM1I7Q4_POLDO
MSDSSDVEMFFEAAAGKIAKMSNSSAKTIILQFHDINEPSSSKDNKLSCGFHLTKTLWDAYPWIALVENESVANRAGLRPGDCLLNVNDIDLLGLKLKDIADLIKEAKEDRNNVMLRIWRYEYQSLESGEVTGVAWKRPLPEIVSKFANVFSECLRCLECPVCLERAVSPISQCINGHIICFKCKQRTSKCPMCRVPLGHGRCLLAEKLWKVIFDIFDTNHEVDKFNKSSSKNLTEYLFGNLNKLNITKLHEKNTNVSYKLKRSLLTKLFHGGKAASTENLAMATHSNNELSRLESNNVTNNNNNNNLQRLTLNDRLKSASTSRIPLKQVNREMVDERELQSNISIQFRSMYIDWNFMLDRVLSSSTISRLLSCPFYIQKKCQIVLNINKLLDHLIMYHNSKIVHIRDGKFKIDIPSIYGPNDI